MKGETDLLCDLGLHVLFRLQSFPDIIKQPSVEFRVGLSLPLRWVLTDKCSLSHNVLFILVVQNQGVDNERVKLQEKDHYTNFQTSRRIFLEAVKMII